MDNFVELFEQFVNSQCYRGNKIKCLGSKLLESFNDWLKNKSKTYRMHRNDFNNKMKQHFPEFEYRRCKTGMMYMDLCLKEDYTVKEIPDYNEALEKKREYNLQYYVKNKNKIRTRQKMYYNVKCLYDQELITMSGITEEHLYKRK